MSYLFTPISSSGSGGGVRNVAVDLTNLLETAEIVSSVAVTSSNTAILTVSLAGVNGAIVDLDGVQVAANMGCTFTITTVAVTTATMLLRVEFVGSSGTEDSVEIQVPIVTYLV